MKIEEEAAKTEEEAVEAEEEEEEEKVDNSAIMKMISPNLKSKGNLVLKIDLLKSIEFEFK